MIWTQGRIEAPKRDAALRHALNDSRSHFYLPPNLVYLCGNSLGLQPKRTKLLLNQHLDLWAKQGACAHFQGDVPWVRIEDAPSQRSMTLVGATHLHELTYMNSLTVNIHLMLTAFYNPTESRYSILTDATAFPSDEHALRTHISTRGFDPNDAILFVHPRPGQRTLHSDDILDAIRDNASGLALVFLPGVVYSTGQVLPIQAISATARHFNIPVGFDLAHAVGNIELSLHDWQVDFAVWCTYKYLNSGPGAVSGVFIHHKHSQANLPRLGGWWAVSLESRFLMSGHFVPQPGARGFQLSNVPVMAIVPVIAALDTLNEAGGIKAVRQQSVHMLDFLLEPLTTVLAHRVTIVTPQNARGSQLSLTIDPAVQVSDVNDALRQRHVICDFREPDLLRVAVNPLYNTYADLVAFVEALAEVLGHLKDGNQHRNGQSNVPHSN